MKTKLNRFSLNQLELVEAIQKRIIPADILYVYEHLIQRQRPQKR